MKKTSESQLQSSIPYLNIIVNFSLFVNIVTITVLVVTAYILSEKYIYFWDYANYSSQTVELSSAFKVSFQQGIDVLRSSFTNDYNKLPCLPLVPFVLIFGNSRLTYILGCALVYIVPFALVLGIVATKIILDRSQIVFWLTAFLTLTIPLTWGSILRGYPDLGGAIIIGLVVLIYLQRDNQYFSFKSSWWRIPLIGFLLALSALFRRHFAYSVRAFIIALTLQALFIFITTFRHDQRKSLRNLIESGLFIFLVILSCVISLKVVAPDFLQKVLTTNFRSLYASYEYSPLETFQSYVQIYGYLPWILAILGFGIGLFKSKYFDRLSLGFIIFFGTISIVQWIYLSRQISIQYTTHFTLFVVVGLIAFIWAIWHILNKKLHALFGIIITLFLCANALIGLTSIGEFNSSFRGLFANTTTPLFRKDYNQVVQLINSLKTITSLSEKIYIGASSPIINHSLIRDGEQQLYGDKNAKLNILVTPEIDSRDYYPLQSLLESDYVLIASPFQYHMMSPQEQDLVKVVFDIFTQNQTLSKDFQKLPQQFFLDQGVIIDIYKRIRPTSLETAFSTLQNMRDQIKPEPGSESHWLIVNPSNNSKFIDNKNGSVSIQAVIEKEPTIFVYFGAMPKSIKVSGEIKYTDCSSFPKVSFQLSLLNEKGELIAKKKDNNLSKSSSNFSVSFQEDIAPNYLQIQIIREGKNIDEASSCSIQIDRLTISPV